MLCPYRKYDDWYVPGFEIKFESDSAAMEFSIDWSDGNEKNTKRN